MGAAMTTGEDGKGRARRASLVVLAAMLAWFGLSALGGALGLPAQLALAVDAACLVALGWAIWTLFGVWRAGREGE